MPNIHAMHRRMENFLGYNPDNEIRPDTKGALYSEVQESEWRRRNREQEILDKPGGKIIGYFKTDLKTGEEKFHYTLRYKVIRFYNKITSQIKHSLTFD